MHGLSSLCQNNGQSGLWKEHSGHEASVLRMAKNLAWQQGLLLDQVVGFQLLNRLVEFLVDGNVGVQDAIHTLDHISWHCHGLKGTAEYVLETCQSAKVAFCNCFTSPVPK